MESIPLIIISDFMLFRQGLKMLCNKWPEFTVLADFDWPSISIQQVKQLQAQIIIADLDSAQNNEDYLKVILEGISSFSKIVAIWSDCRNSIISCIRIDGYHSKYSGSAELRRLLDSIGRGKRPTIPVGLAARLSLANGEGVCLLTSRQLEISSLVAHGFTSKEIAIKISLSIKTIEVHRRDVLKKLHLSNTSQLVNFLTSGGK